MQRRPERVQHQTEPGGVQQRGALAHDAAHGQNAAGNDAVDGVGQHHRANHAPLSGPQAQRTFPVGLRNGFQAFLRGAEDGGQDHHHQRQTAGEDACLQIHLLHKKQHSHQSEDDGGDSRQGLRGELNEAHQLPVFGIFRQVDGSAYPQRQNDDHGHQNDIQSVENIRQNTDGILNIAGLAGQEIPRQARNPPIENIADEKHQQRAGQSSAQPHQRPHSHVVGAAAGR